MRISPVNNFISIGQKNSDRTKNIRSTYNPNFNEISNIYYQPVNFRGNPAGIVTKTWEELANANFAKSIDKLNFDEKEILIEDSFHKLDGMKNEFVDIFCKETGFPNLKKVTETMEGEILKCAEKLSSAIKAPLLFAGYDKNCSMGRGLALPGSDCDGLFFVFGKNSAPSISLRAEIGYTIDQKIINMPINHTPEVFNIDEIHNGFNIANQAFKELRKDLRATDYENFEINILRNDNDFVRAGDFNIRLGKYINQNEKTFISMISYLAEYLRAGKVLANNLDNETIKLIKSSPLYKYGNITRQEGLQYSVKSKIDARKELENDFKNKDLDGKYNLIKDTLLSVLGHPVSAENSKYFKNAGNGQDMNTELGNIIEMYKKLFGIDVIPI